TVRDCVCCCVSSSLVHLDVATFPTRRSSDLVRGRWPCGASLRRLGGRLGAAADAVGDLAPFGRGRVAGGAALDGLRAGDGPPAVVAQGGDGAVGEAVGVDAGQQAGRDQRGDLGDGGGVLGAEVVGAHDAPGLWSSQRQPQAYRVAGLPQYTHTCGLIGGRGGGCGPATALAGTCSMGRAQSMRVCCRLAGRRSVGCQSAERPVTPSYSARDFGETSRTCLPNQLSGTIPRSGAISAT